MDLRGMLNEPATQAQRHQPQPLAQPNPPPRLHTHQSSYDHTPSYESQSHPHPSLERPPLLSSSSSYHGQPPPTNDYRTSANGSYFTVQSPHHHQNPASASASASTPSATGQSIYGQSPGPHAQIHTPREGIPPSHPFQSPFIPSPSPSGPYPPTPGSVHHYPNSATPSTATTYQYPSAHPSLTGHSPTLREDYISANGNAHPQQRHLSPQAQFHPPPVTPLGPPISYPRPSPHPHRPTSHGQESVRRSSIGSVSSVQSRDYNQPPYDHSRTGSGSAQRTYSGDVRERERSIESVSPKTIPKPPPVRRQSGSRYQELMSDPYVMAQPSPAPNSNSSASIAQLHTTPDRALENQHYDTTPKSSSTSIEPRPAAQYYHPEPSPAPSAHNQNSVTPQPAHTSLPAQQSPPAKSQSQPQSSLKRTASNISDITTTPLAPRKRARRDEIPIWARSARQLPLYFTTARPLSPPPPQVPIPPPSIDVVVKKESVGSQMVNGQSQSHAMTPPIEVPWEPSIVNEAAFDDLTKRVCDWIFVNIGDKHLPAGGAVFEIEAKVGMIFDEGAGDRLRLPVQTETVFDRQNYRGRTSFKSSMDVAQHKALNGFLNKLVQDSVRQAQETGQPPRIGYDHPHEYDEFYELTPEGQNHLPPSIMTYLNHRHKPRVRRTVDEKTNMVKAQIIKSRIADFEIYNPRTAFDYRISISIESPWDGDHNWLTETTESRRDRKKDRMSYRHLAYQIDLTQVSYPNTTDKEHELEVEISTEQIRLELAKAKAGQAHRYMQLVKGFVDNVRILCRLFPSPD